jgi:hypothetical protein
VSGETVRATVYLQVAPDRNTYMPADDVRSIAGAKVVASTQGKSSKPKAGTVEVKLTIELPKAAFLALRPEAVVVIPATLTQPHPVTVEAVDAHDTEKE